MSSAILRIQRRTSRQVKIGHVFVGGDAPIMVQSMTNTDTEDIAATVAQVAALALAGSEVVRITVNTLAAARAVAKIRAKLDAMDVNVPLAGDFHFNGHKLLTEVPDCAIALAKLILMNYNPDLRNGDLNVLALLFDMNKLFRIRHLKNCAKVCICLDIKRFSFQLRILIFYTN